NSAQRKEGKEKLAKDNTLLITIATEISYKQSENICYAVLLLRYIFFVPPWRMKCLSYGRSAHLTTEASNKNIVLKMTKYD
ncbi:MAG: hypothetical protein ACJ749_03305, partial [Flavisolibacter sp.]